MRKCSFLILYFAILISVSVASADLSGECRPNNPSYTEYRSTIDKIKPYQRGYWMPGVDHMSYISSPSCQSEDIDFATQKPSVSKMIDTAENQWNKLLSLKSDLGLIEGVKRLLTEYDICKAEIDNVFSDVEIYLKPKSNNEVKRGYSRVDKLIKRISSSKASNKVSKNKCENAAKKAYILSSVANLYTTLQHPIADLYLHLAILGLNENWLVPLTTSSRQVLADGHTNNVWQQQESNHFKLQGAYSCVNSNLYIDTQLLPNNLAAVLIHELDHLIADKNGILKNLPIPLADLLAQEFEEKHFNDLNEDELLLVAKTYAHSSIVRDEEYFNILHSLFIQYQVRASIGEEMFRIMRSRGDLSLFTLDGPFVKILSKVLKITENLEKKEHSGSLFSPMVTFHYPGDETEREFVPEFECFVNALPLVYPREPDYSYFSHLSHYSPKTLGCLKKSVFEGGNFSDDSYVVNYKNIRGKEEIDELMSRVSLSYFGKNLNGQWNWETKSQGQNFFFPIAYTYTDPEFSKNAFLAISNTLLSVSPQCKLFKTELDAGGLFGYLGMDGNRGGNAGVKPGNAGVKGEDSTIRPGNAGVKGELPVRPCYSIDQL